MINQRMELNRTRNQTGEKFPKKKKKNETMEIFLSFINQRQNKTKKKYHLTEWRKKPEMERIF